jgi:hypothetical protein
MRTDEIAAAFQAIAEEAEKMIGGDVSEEVHNGLDTIVKIARHQKDIRQSPRGSCKANRKR